MQMIRKHGTVTLADQRRLRVVLSTPDADRAGDVVEPLGIDTSNYEKNPIVLAEHHPDRPIGNCVAISKNVNGVSATIQFPSPGVSATADETYELCKAGILSGVSIGFQSIESEPLKGGGRRHVKTDLLEVSVVSVPANPNALVIQKAFDPMQSKPYAVPRVHTAYDDNPVGIIGGLMRLVANQNGRDKIANIEAAERTYGGPRHPVVSANSEQNWARYLPPILRPRRRQAF